MTRYDSYNIDNDMWYKKRKHIYHLMGVYDGGLFFECTRKVARPPQSYMYVEEL